MSKRYKIIDQHGLNFLTLTIVGWIDIFSRQIYRDILLDSLRYCQQHKGLNIYGYVVMTNHLHMIVNTDPPFLLSDVMRDFKAHTGRTIIDAIKNQPESRREWMLHVFDYFAFGKRDKQQYACWQSGHHPIELFSEKVILQKLAYIHENPVRAGFVQKPEDWVYGSASNYALGSGLLEVVLLKSIHDVET